MNDIYDLMLRQHDLSTADNQRNATYEVMQQVVLSGLYRGGFFKEAAFYGGTCRIRRAIADMALRQADVVSVWAGVTFSLTWSRAEKQPYSALISGFEHLLGIIMEKIDFERHSSILSPELCFFSWI